jgi:hypothetical protein
MRLRWILNLVFLVGSLGWAYTGHAQEDDPFGDSATKTAPDPTTLPTRSSNKQPADPSNQPLDPFEKNAVVLSLRKTPPTTHSGLAKAVDLTSRIRRWDQVGYWLQAIEELGVSEPSAYEMVQAVGEGTFINLSTTVASEIEATARNTAAKILQMASSYRNNPAVIANNLSRLNSTNDMQRRDAFRGLLQAGDAGIGALLNQLMAPGASQPTRAVSEALRKMGPPAQSAWRSAMQTPHPDAKKNLLMAAMGTHDPSFLDDARLHFVDLNQDPVDPSRKPGSLSYSPEDWLQYYQVHSQRLDEKLSNYNKIRYVDSEDTSVSWTLQRDGRTLSATACDPSVASWKEIVEEADRVLLSGKAIQRDSAVAVAVKLQEAGWNGVTPNLSGDLQFRLDRFEFCCMVADAAHRLDLPYASRFAVYALGRFSDPMPREVRERLVSALDSGYLPVRYDATAGLLNALLESGADKVAGSSFFGRSKLDRNLREIEKVSAVRLFAIVGGSHSLRTHVRSLLEELEIRGEEFANASSLIAYCKSGAPLEGVLIVSNVTEMDSFQLVQRIAGTPAGSKLSIGVLADSLSNEESRLLADTPRVVLGAIPPESPGMVGILRRMDSVSPSPQIEESDVIRWKDWVEQWNLKSRSMLVHTPQRQDQVDRFDTPLAQKRLLGRSLDKELPLPDRQQASQFFVQSVRQFGLLLSSETADAQYDVYNDRGRSEPETKAILGRILDAIEASRGARDWSTVAP